MNHQATHALRHQVQALLPQAVLSSVGDDAEHSASCFTVVLANQIVLSISAQYQQTGFVVLRISNGPRRALPFEESFEVGFGRTAPLTAAGVLRVLAECAELPAPPPATR